MEDTQETKKARKISFKFISILVVILVAAAGYGAAYYFYNQYRQTKIVLDNPQVASQNEVKEITDKLGKIYDLPKDEEPTVATVLDKEKLKDQAFFAKAENGDKVVIFTKSQLAILFRASEGKIITVSPVSLQEPQTAESSPIPQADEEPAVQEKEE